jgi:hypothetical protein
MTVGFDGFDGFVERQAAIDPPPLTGVAVLLEIEAVAGDPVEAGEGRVKLFAEVAGEAGTISLHEAVLRTAPFAEDIDGVVELRGPDLGQEPGPHEVGDQVFARCGDARLLSLGEGRVRLRRLAHGVESYLYLSQIPMGFPPVHLLLSRSKRVKLKRNCWVSS